MLVAVGVTVGVPGPGVFVTVGVGVLLPGAPVTLLQAENSDVLLSLSVAVEVIA